MNTMRHDRIAAALAPRNLTEQLSATARECIAMLLGFSSCEHAADFHTTLREITPLAEGFTVGEALTAYLAHIAKRLDPKAPIAA
jgi:hypothetical protein